MPLSPPPGLSHSSTKSTARDPRLALSSASGMGPPPPVATAAPTPSAPRTTPQSPQEHDIQALFDRDPAIVCVRKGTTTATRTNPPKSPLVLICPVYPRHIAMQINNYTQHIDFCKAPMVALSAQIDSLSDAEIYPVFEKTNTQARLKMYEWCMHSFQAYKTTLTHPYAIEVLTLYSNQLERYLETPGPESSPAKTSATHNHTQSLRAIALLSQALQQAQADILSLSQYSTVTPPHAFSVACTQ